MFDTSKSPQHKISDQEFDRQLELENWAKGWGGEIATAGKWQKGAKNFMTQTYGPRYLQVCVEMWKKSYCRAQLYGAELSILDKEEHVRKCAGETLFFLLTDVDEGMSRTACWNAAGKRLEFLLFLLSPAMQKGHHLANLRRLNGRNLSMRDMKSRLTAKNFKKAADWRPLEHSARLKLGCCFVEIAREVTKLFDWDLERIGRKKSLYKLEFTDAYWRFISDWGRCLETMRPAAVPMVIPPRRHDLSNQGGYYQLLANYCHSYGTEEMQQVLKHAHPCVLESINYLQSICFNYNHLIMSYEIKAWKNGLAIGGLPAQDRLAKPKFAELKEKGGTAYWSAKYEWRQDKLKNVLRTKFLRSLVVYEKYKDEEKLWAPWTVCHRGRKQQRGITFQSSGVHRNQWQFEQGSPMLPHLKEVWWALGDAAGIEKCWQRRELFYRENIANILQCGMDPMGQLGFWEGRKEPWRFLALVNEIFEVHQDPSYCTHLIFQLDQTNSGYGHLAALTRDRSLCSRTNVIGHEYNDLYGDIRKTVVGLIRADTRADDVEYEDLTYAHWWEENGKAKITRELIKLTVMPVVYNRSNQSLLNIIQSFIEEVYVNFLVPDGIGGTYKTLDLSIYLAKKINRAVEVIMPGVHRLDKWLRENIYKINPDGPPGFYSANGVWINVGKNKTEKQAARSLSAVDRSTI